MFNDAVQVVMSYYMERKRALNNEKPKTWFMSEAGGAGKIRSMFDDAQESSTWFTKWSTQTTETPKDELMCRRARIAWLCRGLRDLRAQFYSTPSHASNGTIDTVRDGVEATRLAFENADFHMNVLKGKQQTMSV